MHQGAAAALWVVTDPGRNGPELHSPTLRVPRPGQIEGFLKEK